MGIDSVLLVGSGALENAWSPVYRALQKTFGFEITEADQANLLMARLIFNVRFFKDAFEKSSDNVRPKMEKALAEARRHLKEFRSVLALEIVNSTKGNEVFLRVQQIDLIQKYILKESTAITTNWDLSYLKPIKTSYQIALHGLADQPDSLYLPAEASFDKNSSLEVEKTHTENHHNAISHMETAFRIILWGLGINALDAELTVVFSEAFHDKNINGREYQIIIVDKNPILVTKKLEMFGINKKFVQEISV